MKLPVTCPLRRALGISDADVLHKFYDWWWTYLLFKASVLAAALIAQEIARLLGWLR